MTKVLVLYYSSYGHIETMAKAVADGAREAGAQVDIKRVPETAPEAVRAFPGREILYRRSHLVYALRAPCHRLHSLLG